jgi:hypothetical protein
VQTVAVDEMKCAIKSPFVRLAVTLFNQIKLKRALNSVNYEDKSSDLHDVDNTDLRTTFRARRETSRGEYRWCDDVFPSVQFIHAEEAEKII